MPARSRCCVAIRVALGVALCATCACVQSVEVLSARPQDQADSSTWDMDLLAQDAPLEAPDDAATPVMIDPRCPQGTDPNAQGVLRWVAVGDGVTSATEDGQTWLDHTFAPPSQKGRTALRAVHYTGRAWVAVGGEDNMLVSRSCDGVRWAHDLLDTASEQGWQRQPQVQRHGLNALAPFQGQLYAVGRHGVIARSGDDGLSWQLVRGPALNGQLSGLVEFQGRLIAVGNLWGRGDQELGLPDQSDGVITTSADGVDWSERQEFADAWFAYGVVANDRFALAAGWDACHLSWDGRQWQPCDMPSRFPQVAGRHILSIQVWRDRVVILFKGGDMTSSLDGRSWSPLHNRSMYLSRPYIVHGPDRAVATAIRRRGFSLDEQQWSFEDFLDLSPPALGRAQLWP